MVLQENIFYVGVNDRNKHRFEGLWPLPDGVSYNSYLIQDEKTALIDTVDICYCEELLEKIHEAIGDKPIDYLVINHMEPDHSGSISFIRKYYPNITIVGNAKTLSMLKGFYNVEGNELTVKEGTELDLGKHKLAFYLIPMVHWPETMVTYDSTSKTIFSGDAFGCFGALNGGVVDEKINTALYWREMERYYSNIVGKYGMMVQNALKKLAKLDIQMICSTHGPVWTKQIPEVIKTYDRLSKYEGQEGITIAYGTMYGHTARMAEKIAEAASEAGIRNIVLHNLVKDNDSYVIADVFRYKGLILGSPTYNGELFPRVRSIIDAIAERGVKNRYLGYFGAFTWAGAALKHLAAFNEKMKYEVVADPFELKQGMYPTVEDSCKALGKAMAEKLIAERPCEGKFSNI